MLHDDTLHNDTKHNRLYYVQHNNTRQKDSLPLCCVIMLVSHFLIVILNVIMLSVKMLNVVMLNVIMLNVAMLSVMAPNVGLGLFCQIMVFSKALTSFLQNK